MDYKYSKFSGYALFSGHFWTGDIILWQKCSTFTILIHSFLIDFSWRFNPDAIFLIIILLKQQELNYLIIFFKNVSQLKKNDFGNVKK